MGGHVVETYRLHLCDDAWMDTFGSLLALLSMCC